MENQMIKFCADGRAKLKEVINRSEYTLSLLGATRVDLEEYLREHPLTGRWSMWQQGYISRKINIDKQPVEVNKKSGMCFVSLPTTKSTYYSVRDYYGVRCDEFVKWLEAKRA